jgi:hypothetical protein
LPCHDTNMCTQTVLYMCPVPTFTICYVICLISRSSVCMGALSPTGLANNNDALDGEDREEDHESTDQSTLSGMPVSLTRYLGDADLPDLFEAATVLDGEGLPIRIPYFLAISANVPFIGPNLSELMRHYNYTGSNGLDCCKPLPSAC